MYNSKSGFRTLAVVAVILFATLGLMLPVSAVAQEGRWKAGVARAIITPDKPMMMVGYGNLDRVAREKLDDLWVKALALEDPHGTRVLLLTADLVGIHRPLSDAICDEIVKSLKLPREAILIATSHTHTGPAPVISEKIAMPKEFPAEEYANMDTYAVILRKTFAKVAQEAFATRVPARVAWGSGSTDFAVNRRENRPESKVPELRAAGKLKGPADHQVPVLRVSTSAGKLQAVVFGYACHAISVGGLSRWSADYPGFAQAELETAHPGAVALFFAGCGGDQAPSPRGAMKWGAEHGRALAGAVEKVLEAEMRPVTDRLEVRFAVVELPYAYLPNQKELEELVNRRNAGPHHPARLFLKQIKEEGTIRPTYPYPVQVWNLGTELTLVALGGEPVVDYSLRLKKELGPDRTWVAGYCNDVMAYIPSLRVLREGGYEGKDSMAHYGHPSTWGSTVEELIVAKVHELAGR